MADRQIGSVGVQTDVALVAGDGQQVDSFGLLLDVSLPTGVNYGWLGTLVEVVIPQIVTVSGTAQVTLLGLTISGSGTLTGARGTIRVTLVSLRVNATGTQTFTGAIAWLQLVPLIVTAGSVYVLPPTPEPVVLPYQPAREGMSTAPMPTLQTPIVTGSEGLEPPPPGTATHE